MGARFHPKGRERETAAKQKLQSFLHANLGSDVHHSVPSLGTQTSGYQKGPHVVCTVGQGMSRHRLVAWLPQELYFEVLVHIWRTQESDELLESKP